MAQAIKKTSARPRKTRPTRPRISGDGEPDLSKPMQRPRAAAKILGLQYDHVLAMIREGRLHHVSAGRCSTFISTAYLLKLRDGEVSV